MIISGPIPCDILDLDLPQPPKDFLSLRTAPAELGLSDEMEEKIRWYCYAVALDCSSIARTILHKDVCLSLGLSHHDFRPFEDDSITRLPLPTEAVKIFFNALREARCNTSQSL